MITCFLHFYYTSIGLLSLFNYFYEKVAASSNDCFLIVFGFDIIIFLTWTLFFFFIFYTLYLEEQEKRKHMTTDISYKEGCEMFALLGTDALYFTMAPEGWLIQDV